MGITAHMGHGNQVAEMGADTKGATDAKWAVRNKPKTHGKRNLYRGVMTQTRNKPGRKPGKPKTGGRKKGTPNQVTADARQLIRDAITANRERLLKEYGKLKGAELWRVTEKLINYIAPKQAAVQADINATITSLSEEQINELATDILNQMNE